MEAVNKYEQAIKANLQIGDYSLVPLLEQDIFLIKEWRNDQIDVLRQKQKLSNKEQSHFFRNVVMPSFSEPEPKLMLFSFLYKNRCIGYGGLTNIDWQAQRAELSFLLETSRACNSSVYRNEFSIFLNLIKKAAFQGLQLNRIFTETYDIRPLHIDILEKNGFNSEGRMRGHVRVNGQFTDSIIHGFLKDQYVAE
ncbi:MAG: GNAT family N-acetyltransferase [Prolixibacteraceae bacterium]|nr:GNAT family N-acetyltransferase [Prolixibacteraceae bacterium]MBN2773196.1 GNAT family N-acetyltransferase [Prolixibacteraceae bacterium]